jgi:ferredoxin-thioredoxin reductase catalytic chain
MDPEQLVKIWKTFTEKKDFILNPDADHVKMIADGVLKKEQKCGLKLCPCRLGDGSPEKDLELICPCNFKTHSTWLTPFDGKEPMCWCGLFVKRG